MKIIYLHQYFSTPTGSTGTRSYEMARELVHRGHEVTVLCGNYNNANTGIGDSFIDGYRKGKVNGINIVEFDLQYSNNNSFMERILIFARFVFRCVRFVLFEDYDIIVATTTPLTVSIPAIIAKWARRKKFIFEIRDLWPDLPIAMGIIKNPLVIISLRWLEWVAYKSADKLIGLAPGIVDGIVKKNIDEKIVSLVPNGCDIDIFKSESIKPIRPKGINDRDFVAIFAGTHGLANGLDIIIKVGIELKNIKASRVKILMIGSGALKNDLVCSAQANNLDNIIFLDPVPKQVLANYFAGSDVGLQILANIPEFYYGTSPNKFFDYISAGLPVVNNYPGWVADMIKENSCGYVVEPDNARKFAETLALASSSPQRLIKMGHNALNLAYNCFQRKYLANKWVNFVLE